MDTPQTPGTTPPAPQQSTVSGAQPLAPVQPTTTIPGHPMPTAGGGKKVVVGVIVLILLGVLGMGGYYLYSSLVGDSNSTATDLNSDVITDESSALVAPDSSSPVLDTSTESSTSTAESASSTTEASSASGTSEIEGSLSTSTSNTSTTTSAKPSSTPRPRVTTPNVVK